MHDKYNLEVQEKKQKVEAVKRDFERQILKTFGDVLINEIDKIIENYNNENNSKRRNSIEIALPNFLKPIFTLLNRDNLLIETAFFYIFLNFNNLPTKYEEKYNENIKNILKIIENASEIKNLIITSSESADNSNFLVEVKIPEELESTFNQIADEISNFLFFGVLAIIKWLGLLSSKYLSIFKTYEEYFQNHLIG